MCWKKHGMSRNQTLLGVPRESHRYFIEPLSQTRHVIFALYGRFIKFGSAIATKEMFASHVTKCEI